jgi:hypothetical protein
MPLDDRVERGLCVLEPLELVENDRRRRSVRLLAKERQRGIPGVEPQRVGAE